MSKLRFFPSYLFVVLLGVVFNQLFIGYIPFLTIEQTHLVNIPEVDFTELDHVLKGPNFSQIWNHKVWIVAGTIAVLASLETLLNLEAVDNIDYH